MDIGDFFTLAPKLMPLMPRIDKAIATAQRIMADPDVKDLLAVGQEVAQILEQEGTTNGK